MRTRNLFYTALLGSTLLACKPTISDDSALRIPETIAVKTHALQSSEGMISIAGTGMIHTENEARYSFKIGGVIHRIFVSEGEAFKKGQLLASLKLDEIEAGYAQSKLALEKSERDLKRVQNLYRDSVATLEQFQNSQTGYDIAKQQLETVAFNRNYAYIYATANGFVTKKLANEGEIIGGGMPVLAINESNDNDWILKIGISDKDWALIRTGDKATIQLDAFPDQKISGIVSKKLLAAEQNSGSFEVEIKMESGKIKPALGMFGKATITTNKKQQYQTIPYEAMIEADGRKAFVFVPLQDGKVKKTPIEIAGFDNQGVKVSHGLEGIQEIVISNSAFLNENSMITIIK